MLSVRVAASSGGVGGRSPRSSDGILLGAPVPRSVCRRTATGEGVDQEVFNFPILFLEAWSALFHSSR